MTASLPHLAQVMRTLANGGVRTFIEKMSRDMRHPDSVGQDDMEVVIRWRSGGKVDVFSIPMDDLGSLAGIPEALRTMHTDLLQMKATYDSDAALLEEVEDLEDMLTVVGYGIMTLQRAFLKHLMRRCGLLSLTFPAELVPAAEVLERVEETFKTAASQHVLGFLGMKGGLFWGKHKAVDFRKLDACLEDIHQERTTADLPALELSVRRPWGGVLCRKIDSPSGSSGTLTAFAHLM